MAATVYLAVCVASVAMLCQPWVGAKRPGEGMTVADANNQFAMELYRELMKTHDENIFFSPIGISSSLAMILLGAQGSTAEQLKKALHLDRLDKEKVKEHLSYRTLLKKLQSEGAAENLVHIANRIFLAKGIHPVKEYEQESLNFYSTVPESVDFNSVDAVEERINDWVDEELEHDLDDVVPTGFFDPKTQSAVVNAMFFQGIWLNQFNKVKTRYLDFHRGVGDKVGGQLMIQKACKYQLSYDTEFGSQYLEVPMAGNKLVMKLLIPNHIIGLAESVEPKLSLTQLQKLHEKAETFLVDFFLPKVELDESYTLKDALKSIGLAGIFEDGDLSGLTRSKDFNIGEVFHKASMSIQEDGATDPDTAPKDPDLPKHKIVVNRPFIFFIEDIKTGAIVYMGRVRKPTASEKPGWHDEL